MRFFPCGENRQINYFLRPVETGYELLPKRLCTGIGVRLKHAKHTPFAHGKCRLHRFGNFRRMVGVIAHHVEFTLGMPRPASVHSAKTCQSLRNLQQWQLQQLCHGKHGKSVVHVVSSAHFQTTLAGKNAVAVQRKGCFPSYMNVFACTLPFSPKSTALLHIFCSSDGKITF